MALITEEKIGRLTQEQLETEAREAVALLKDHVSDEVFYSILTDTLDENDKEELMAAWDTGD